MRRKPTPAEARLWEVFRRRSRGLKFRRQFTIEPFIVDFYCPQARLVVEVDGEIHQKQVEEDAVRQDFLERLGGRVVRFSNDEVMNALPNILRRIDQVVAEQSKRIEDLGKHLGPLKSRGNIERT
jgi:very-short-patch-repair endonuclease